MLTQPGEVGLVLRRTARGLAEDGGAGLAHHAGGNELETVVEKVRALTGRIDLVHANDSRDAFDSGADRHASFGAGEIDPDLLAAVVRDAGAPVVCETPGPAEAHVADFAWLRARL